MARLGNKISSFPVKIAAAALVGVLTVTALTLGRDHLRILLDPSSKDIERAMQSARETPLVRLVLADNPALEQKLRAAVEEEIRNPLKRPLPSLQFGAETRKQYILPALRNADDASALIAVRELADVLRYLQTADPALCRDYGISGLQDPSRLDPRATELIKKAFASQEDAYRVGKSAPPQPTLSTNELIDLLVSAGYKDEDLDRLFKYEQLGIKDACTATVKMYTAPALLPPAKGGALARWLLLAAQ
ncbi:MAG: hypothetical protein U1E21_10380 [Reyranellaceae bacterium]